MRLDQRRVSALNSRAPDTDGCCVVYWMQHSQRADENPALERAVAHANACNLPLLVLFVVDPAYPEANARHYTFMLEGLKETMAALRRRGAHMALRLGNPPEIAVKVAQKAAVVVTDRGYLRHLVEWRAALADAAPCLVEAVEGDVIVPVESASRKRESAARTIRRKLTSAASDFCHDDQPEPLHQAARGLDSEADVALGDIGQFVAELGCDDSVPAVKDWSGGTKAARKRLAAFVADGLARYGEGRSDIVARNVSHLSPYLHFGQIAPMEVYRAAMAADAPAASKDSFIDEFLVRRELAVNFVYHTPDYDQYSCLPDWAKATLDAHRNDRREATYTRSALENSKTDDPYWNAAMREMRVTGYLHNHLRMYWGKRILAWSRTPQTAYADALYLNNKYLLDGRDANSYANIGWLFGLHDRGWPEREVFGKVRSMTSGGLKRKFDVDAYVAWAQAL